VSWPWAALRLAGGLALLVAVGIAAMRHEGRRPSTEVAAWTDALKCCGERPRAVPALLLDWGRLAGRLFLVLTPELLVLVLALGAARAWLFPIAGPHAAFGALPLVGVAVAGTLFVIPTAGEVPIVQSLLAYGVAPGLAGALLLTLPALSLPSLLMLRRTIPVRLLLIAAAIVAGLGVATGIVAQALL